MVEPVGFGTLAGPPLPDPRAAMNTFPRPKLRVEHLEDRCVPAAFLGKSTAGLLPSEVTGVAIGGEPVVVVGSQTGGVARVFIGTTAKELRPFGADFAGGVSVAAADVNGDGVTDIVAGAGAGSAPRVVVLDAQTGAEVRSFLAFDPSFTGGVSVATGDLNFDGYADIVVAAASGGAPHVKVFDGKTGAEVRSFYAYDRSFTGGVRVAAADVNGDFRDDIVTTPGGGGGPNVRVVSGVDGTQLRSFFAYDPSYTGGVNVAAADIDRDGFAEIITGSAAGSSHVKVFGGKTGAEQKSYYAFAPDLPGGVSVAAGVFNNDLTADIAVASSGDSPQVRVIDGQTGNDLTDLAAGFPGGVNVGVGAARLVSLSLPVEVPTGPVAIL